MSSKQNSHSVLCSLRVLRVNFFPYYAHASRHYCGTSRYSRCSTLVRPQFRGSRFGQLILDHLASHARAHGVTLLRLETGIHQKAAIRMYERAGFYKIPPFGPYTNDPLSLCYEKPLVDG